MILTPYVNSHTNRRARLDVSDTDAKKTVRGTRWTATVIDRRTGKKYKLRDAACGSPHCHCAAVIVKEI